VSESNCKYDRHSDREVATVNNRDTAILVLTVLAAIILPGLANWGFSTLGYPWVGSGTWALGYGLGVVFIWYEWVRPLDITGPEGASRSEDSGE
jgi:hypothetical protein